MNKVFYNHCFSELYFLNFNFSIWKYEQVKKGDFLIVLKELDLKRENNENNSFIPARPWEALAGVRTAVVAPSPRTQRPEAYTLHAEGETTTNNIYELAKEELEKTGKIKGFEVLNLRALEKLWISHYDLEVLEFNDCKT